MYLEVFFSHQYKLIASALYCISGRPDSSVRTWGFLEIRVHTRIDLFTSTSWKTLQKKEISNLPGYGNIYIAI